MIVEIFSIHSAVSAKPCGTTWRGDLDLSLASSDEGRLELVFRTFNRVDEGDHERMEALGYTMPSLSVGDFVTLHIPMEGKHGPIECPHTWRVASCGFKAVTGDTDYLMRSAV